MAAKRTFSPAIAFLVLCLGAVTEALVAEPRGLAGLEVTYDGVPRFEQIAGTSLLYARNTSAQVLKVEDCYYAVDQGIWYTADSAYGPWSVAGSRPEEVENIPPDSPAYNLKYVYIYDFTPDVDHADYRPGYPWAFPYRGAVTFDTGYNYRPWMSPAWHYPRPGAWGYGMPYDPWYGWFAPGGYPPRHDSGPRRGDRRTIQPVQGPADRPPVARPPGEVRRQGPSLPASNPARMRRHDGNRGERR